MLESSENALQVFVLLVCAGIAVYRAVVYQSRTWTIAFFFFGSWVLGDIYWLLCLIFFDKTSQVSIVSDLSWYASLVFLYLLLDRVGPPREINRKQLLPWLGPAFSLAMAVFFMFWGEILSNLIYAALMGVLLFASIHRLLNRQQYPDSYFLAVAVLIICLLEYGLWISSCFWNAETLANPYYWFDFLLTLSFLFILPATRKAVAV